ARQLKAIADEAKGADALILATDPDREGEAISWHVQEVLAKKKALPAHVERATFNAITKSAVLEAMANPRGLDEDLIDAYRAPRALAYLVGRTLSPVLWRKLPGAKAAVRAHSVSLRQVAARGRELGPAAGGRAQARLCGQPDDAPRPASLRGRRDHLHAHRWRADGRGGDLRRPPRGRVALRCRLRPRQAAPLRNQSKECTGSA